MPSWVYRDGKLVEKTADVSRGTPGLQIVPDIQPYKSMITGERIRSRSHHRDHLRDHGCIEVGNEKPQAPKATPRLSSDQRKRMLHEAFSNATDAQARSSKTFTVHIPEGLRALLKQGS